MKQSKLLALVAFVAIVFFSGLTFSCADDSLLDFDKMEGIENWQPDFTLALGEATLETRSLLAQAGENDFLTYSGDSIFVRYNMDLNGVEPLNTKDLFTQLEDTELPPIEVNVDVPEIDAIQALKGSPYFLSDTTHLTTIANNPVLTSGTAISTDDFEDDSRDTTEIAMEGGGELHSFIGSFTLDYKFPDFADTIILTLYNVRKYVGGPYFEKTFIKGAGGLSGYIEVGNASDDYIFDLKEAAGGSKPGGGIDYGIHVVSLFKNLTIGLLGKTDTVSLQLRDFKFKSITGLFPKQSIDVPHDLIPMGGSFLDMLKLGEGNYLKLPGARINLTISNWGLDMPIEPELEFVAYNADIPKKSEKQNTSELDDFKFTGWKVGQDTIKETKPIPLTNILALPPKDSITYEGTIVVNRDTTVAATIANGAEIKVAVDVEIPLTLDANVTYTMEPINVSSLGDVAENLSTATLILRGENGLPLTLGKGHIFFMNDLDVAIDSVDLNLFDSPEVDAKGNVIGTAPIKQDIVLSEKNVASLAKTKSMVISLKMITGGTTESHPVTLKRSGTFTIRLGIQAKGNIKI
ncbi:hypothetical protein FACS1894199_03800 [Bacteroidia bacterium]|nr:hypothetical protein FACS1894199_03800 [Bacteroidia bacterium]